MDLTQELNKALQSDGAGAESIFRFAGTVVLDLAPGTVLGDVPQASNLGVFLKHTVAHFFIMGWKAKFRVKGLGLMTLNPKPLNPKPLNPKP